jgi:hypothetical protein
MAVQDDLRRLSEVDSIYIGYSVTIYNLPSTSPGLPFTSWFKGRLQQADDGSWIVRSISSDGAIAGFQLGTAMPSWQSSETPAGGTVISIPINIVLTLANPIQIPTGWVYLQQQLPQELTN